MADLRKLDAEKTWVVCLGERRKKGNGKEGVGVGFRATTTKCSAAAAKVETT